MKNTFTRLIYLSNDIPNMLRYDMCSYQFTESAIDMVQGWLVINMLNIILPIYKTHAGAIQTILCDNYVY